MEDTGYKLKRSGLQVAGKEAILLLNGGMAVTEGAAGGFVEAGQALASLGGGIFSGMGKSLGVLVALGATTALSAGLTQMDYYHQRNLLKEAYAEEIAAKLHKNPRTLNNQDFEDMARQNRTIGDAVHKAEKNRNFNVFLSVAASLASFALLGLAMNLTMFDQVPKLVVLVAQGSVGLVAYNAVKGVLHTAGKLVFGLSKKTTNDRIMELKKDREAGKIISAEQVMAVFVDAIPQLGRMVEAGYGRRFDKLTVEDKQRATHELERLVPVARLAQEINEGKINVTELAFAVEGEISGVHHAASMEGPKKGIFSRVMAKCRNALGFGARQPEPCVPVIQVSEKPMEYNTLQPATAFAERHPSKELAGLSQLERLNKRMQIEAQALEQHTQPGP